MVSAGRLLALREQGVCKPHPSLMSGDLCIRAYGSILDGVFIATTLLISIAHGLNGGFGEGHRSETVRVRSPVQGGCSWQG